MSGLRDDLERFMNVGEENRMDLEEFIKHGQISEHIQIPIKIVDLPEFVYDFNQQGGIGQAGEGQDPEVGDPVEFPDGDGDEAGDEPGEHGYYEMDPEEFAEELDEELGLDLEPKGKRVIEEKLGDMVEMSRAGPRSALDVDYLYKQGLKRELGTWNDSEWIDELCLVNEDDVELFRYARSLNVPVSLNEITNTQSGITSFEYDDIDDFEDRFRDPILRPPGHEIDSVQVRDEDERYRHPEMIQEKQKNVVVINIRDVSGSMGAEKRDLVERLFTPMDWYLQGKYERAEFRYIAHDAEAWEVERDDFFGIKSGGGTKVSTAYALAKQMLDEQYPWEEWNRFVFGAGDGDNWPDDTRGSLIPLIEDIDANMHAYVEVKPRASRVVSKINSEIDSDDDVVTTQVDNRDDILPAIEEILGGNHGDDDT